MKAFHGLNVKILPTVQDCFKFNLHQGTSKQVHEIKIDVSIYKINCKQYLICFDEGFLQHGNTIKYDLIHQKKKNQSLEEEGEMPLKLKGNITKGGYKHIHE